MGKTCLIALQPMTFPTIMGNGEGFAFCFFLNLLNFNLISGQTIERGGKKMRNARIGKTCSIALQPTTFPAIMGSSEGFIACFNLKRTF